MRSLALLWSRLYRARINLAKCLPRTGTHRLQNADRQSGCYHRLREHETYNHSRCQTRDFWWKIPSYLNLDQRHQWEGSEHLLSRDDFLETSLEQVVWSWWLGQMNDCEYTSTPWDQGFFQLACRPISSVERPAWTAASSKVTRHEWTVSLSTVSIRLLRSVAGISRSSIIPWCAKQRNHFTVRWWDGGRWSNSDFEFNSNIQKSRSWTSSSLNKLHPTSSRSLWRNPTLGTMNLVPDLFRSTLVCHATPNRPSSCMINSAGLTWIASSKRSDAKTMQRSHHTKILAWANSLELTTIASRVHTAAIGMGTASFKVVARAETIWSWMAFSRWSSKSGRSIASREATHLTEVMLAQLRGHTHADPKSSSTSRSCRLSAGTALLRRPLPSARTFQTLVCELT